MTIQSPIEEIAVLVARYLSRSTCPSLTMKNIITAANLALSARGAMKNIATTANLANFADFDVSCDEKHRNGG
ncbi:hypothetical protein [Cohnella soli]|uniref:Uncharacterized protein n=1 Tax=Cohnella soli TaxID=425005 RepID=A0ABW0HUJ0_9BACL